MKISSIEAGAGLTLKTEGLAERFDYEVSVMVDDPGLKEGAIDFIDLVVRYVEAGYRVAPDETLGYGCWVTKMHLNDKRELLFFEQSPVTGVYVPGISTTLRLWAEQHAVCERAGADYAAPTFDQMIVISDGILEGDPADGVRYPSPEHMSGWWLTTDRFDGSVKNLKTVHTQHVAVSRPDLVRFLALPFGYRFHGATNDVWLDEKKTTDTA
ncbi:immunity protein Imm33 domain-containing protein [Pseudomonas ogarae]|uniref:Imm33-like domain-containing protein n=1 Tax=Pseudomonas ogarae (strain DSM 112162 / CECT 30235 / F113) TaxID=1114970 RepID=A0ABM6QWV8_PSEO1|nr:hypothetical protein [Pseudomonas ogarae]AUO45739.1 hypothetical protein C1C98_09855 [Pseudomonas ogarae]